VLDILQASNTCTRWWLRHVEQLLREHYGWQVSACIYVRRL